MRCNGGHLIDNQAITLSDGRRLGYQSFGDPGGVPVMFFHGTPGSRLLFGKDDPFAQIPNVWLILPERPGYGISDPKPDRTILDWTNDVSGLADHLGIDTFVVAGESGGGPYALAVASRLSQRVTRVVLLCCPAPPRFRHGRKGMSFGNHLGIALSRFAPFLVKALIRRNGSAFLKRPRQWVDMMIRQMPRPDQELLRDPAVRNAFLRDMKEAYRQGGEGHAIDALLVSRGDWGFDLHEILVPVHLWHGEEDSLVTRKMAEYLAGEIPNCMAHIVPHAGHLLSDNPGVIKEIGELLGGHGSVDD